MVIKNEEHKDDILRMYAEHGNGGRIAKDLGITNYRVYKCLRENDIEPKRVGGKQKHSAKKMIDMYNSGMSTCDIAKALNMSPASVWERLKNNGVKFTTKSTATRGREQEIIEMYQSGTSSREIADYIGLKAKDGVLRVLEKHGIKRRTMHGSNNHAWKGGRLKLNKLIRNSATYVEFRDRIMRERDYTCEVTGERGGKLNVHHVKPFAELIDEFVAVYGDGIDGDGRREELYRAIDEFESFWNESNIIVLKEDVHKFWHKTKLNNEDQATFDELVSYFEDALYCYHLPGERVDVVQELDVSRKICELVRMHFVFSGWQTNFNVAKTWFQPSETIWHFVKK